jgi:hypothetical protein
MVANYTRGKRRFDSYPTPENALEAGTTLARQLSERQVLAPELTNEQAAEYSAAIQKLAPHGVTLLSAVDALDDSLKLLGNLGSIREAVRVYAARHRRVIGKPVTAVVAELIQVKKGRGASKRYIEDLRFRLGRFADAFKMDVCAVSTDQIQAWLDGQKLKPQSYVNFRRVLHGLFMFAVARGYAADNPVTGLDKVETRASDIEIFKPAEIARLLAAASPEFLPALAIGAFAGLRSAEIERLEWSDIDLTGRHITVGASKAKTASRRVVPIADNLAGWLAPYSGRSGKVWAGAHQECRSSRCWNGSTCECRRSAGSRRRRGRVVDAR